MDMLQIVLCFQMETILAEENLNPWYSREINTFAGEVTLESFWLSCQQWSTVKRRNGLIVQESEWKVTEFVSTVKKGRSVYQVYLFPIDML